MEVTRRPRLGAKEILLRLSAFTACAAGCLLLAAASATAAAPSFCVDIGATGSCPAGATMKPSIESAIADASDSSLTNLYVASGSYTALGVFSFGNRQLKVVGVGPTKPIFSSTTTTPGSAVVTTSNSLSSFENIAIAIPSSSGMIGLNATNGGQKIKGVAVSGPNALASRGIQLDGSSPSVQDTTISLDGSGSGSIGVNLLTASNAVVSGVRVADVETGLKLTGTENVALQRLDVTASAGIDASNASGVLASSKLVVPDGGAENDSGVAVIAMVSGGVWRAIELSNCTLVHPGGNGASGVLAEASGAGSSAAVTIDSSIISGFERAPASAIGSNFGSATIDLTYSRYDGATSGAVSDGVGSESGWSNYGFVNPAGGNYRPALGSPLVDAGNPASPSTTTDLDGNPRVVSRGAGLIRDIGAYEAENTAPTANLQIVTAIPSTTSPTAFSAAGSSDAEGDALTYDWRFDGSPGGSGATVKKSFPSEGPHSVQLTVTDSSGSSTIIARQFTVARGFLAIKLRSQSTRISRKGTFKITMSCPVEALSNCAGRLNFQTAKKVDAKNYTERPGWSARAAYLKAATYVFSIAPGSTRKLEVRTYSTFQNVLAKKKRFALIGSLATGTTNNANLTSNRASFTISTPR